MYNLLFSLELVTALLLVYFIISRVIPALDSPLQKREPTLNTWGSFHDWLLSLMFSWRSPHHARCLPSDCLFLGALVQLSTWAPPSLGSWSTSALWIPCFPLI